MTRPLDPDPWPDWNNPDQNPLERNAMAERLLAEDRLDPFLEMSVRKMDPTGVYTLIDPGDGKRAFYRHKDGYDVYWI